MTTKTGVLIINLGTPDATDVPAVRRYLRQFLSDPRVLDISALGRWALLNLIILPTRPAKSAEAYKLIWSERGSPLRYHTEDVAAALQERLRDDVVVRVAMRYQNPSIASAMQAFAAEAVERVVVVPMYPQYASSSTGSVLDELYRVCAKDWNTPHLTVIPPFYDHPDYIDCLAQIAREHTEDLNANFDHLLISFHGLPERHVRKSDVSGSHCLASPDCCERMVTANRYCYRAQCFATAHAVAERLRLSRDFYTICFQSRLGRTPWIQPYTDQVLQELPAKGIKRLAVMIPSFTADCLETLEEIAIRGKEDFLAAGGESYTMIPSLNAHPQWVEALLQLLHEQGLDIAKPQNEEVSVANAN